MSLTIHDIVGLIGVSCSVYCYARVQWQRDFAKHLSYSVLNFIASVLILFSLLYRWNLSSAVINIIWGFISLYGIYRCVKYVRRGREADQVVEERLAQLNSPKEE